MANEVNYSEYFPPPPIAGPFRFRLNEWLRSLARQPRQVFGSWGPLNWSEEKYSTASQPARIRWQEQLRGYFFGAVVDWIDFLFGYSSSGLFRSFGRFQSMTSLELVRQGRRIRST